MQDIQITKKLRSMGLRVTPLRKALLNFMLSQETPVDVQTCIDALTKQEVQFDQVTVYRNLEHFVNKGVLKKVDIRDGKYYYEKADNCAHLICENCGDVSHIHSKQLESITESITQQVAQQSHFKIKVPATDFFGLCEKCQ